jgi:hypothetical protein
MCVCASISPGSSVAPASSIARAPAWYFHLVHRSRRLNFLAAHEHDPALVRRGAVVDARGLEQQGRCLLASSCPSDAEAECDQHNRDQKAMTHGELL